MKFYWTKEKEWLERWDNYLITSNHGNYLLYSDWLSSYITYGFDFNLLILLDKDNNIKGGTGIVYAKALMFKLAIVPIGPIFEIEYSYLFDDFIKEIIKKSKEENACYCQISPDNINLENSTITNNTISEKSIFFSGILGTKFKYVYPFYGYNWVKLNTINTIEEYLLTLKRQSRRNIKLSQNKGTSIVYANTIKDIRLGFNIIKQNALDNNYAVRNWGFFENTVFPMIKTGKLFMLLAYNNGLVKGTAVYAFSGNYYSYLMGGTVKEKPELHIGYLLHWTIIKKSILEKRMGYNISMGGSKGVIRFKNNFNPEQIFSIEKRYWILKPRIFRLYLSFQMILNKNKSLAAKFLSVLNKINGTFKK